MGTERAAVILALRQYPQGDGCAGKQVQHNTPSLLMETFAKLSGTAIIRLDSQSAKLDFPIDSRLRGNDGRFCKGLIIVTTLARFSHCSLDRTVSLSSSLLHEKQPRK